MRKIVRGIGGIATVLAVILAAIVYFRGFSFFRTAAAFMMLFVGVGATVWYDHLEGLEDPAIKNKMLLKALEQNNIFSIYRLVSKEGSLWFTDSIMEWYAEKGNIEDAKTLWKFLYENKKDPLPEDAMDAWIWFRERGWKICRHEAFGCCDGTYDFYICSGDAPDSDIAFLRQYLNENWSLIRIPFKKAKDIRDVLILHDKENIEKKKEKKHAD